MNFTALIFSIVSLSSNFVFAQNNTIVAKMRVALAANGSRVLSLHWDDKNKLGFLQMGLDWVEFDPALHSQGFLFGRDQKFEVRVPAIPQGCRMTALRGHLNGDSVRQSPLSITFAGAECAQVISSVADKIIVYFTDVPSFDGQQVTSALEMTVDLNSL